MLEALKKLSEYTILWKLDADLKQEIPNHIVVKKWLPQTALLKSPRIKLFITHGGLLSTQESTWYAVPMLGTPICFDQFLNVDQSVEAGVAEKYILRTIESESFYAAIKNVLDNPKYAKNVKIRSNSFRDQKEHPLQRAIWWINWIMRNPNATYLQSPGQRMSFIERQSIDVICFILLIVLLSAYLNIKIVVYIVKKIFCGKKYKNKVE